MNYFLQITIASGEQRLVPISDVKSVDVNPGDEIVVMDESGNPALVSLRPEDEDLVIHFEDGAKAILEDFYAQEEGAEPITISLNPVEPVAEAYEFNAQTGNLPNAKSFTLMRFSNTEYVEFVEQLDELNRSVVPTSDAPAQSSSGGEQEAPDAPVVSESVTQNIIQTFDGNGPLPFALSDSGSGVAGGAAIAIDLLTNDQDPVGGGLTLQSIAGIGVSPGDRVTLPSGTVVVVGASGNISVEPGSSFASVGAGDSETESFLYSIVDTNGSISTSQVVITVTGVNDPPEAVADEFSLGEDAPLTVDVLANDSDPDVGDTLTVTGISTPASGTAVLNADNSITFDPNGDFENLSVGETATVTINYVVADDSGASSSSTVSFVVEGRNDAPDANDDTTSTDQNSLLVIDSLVNDTDPDASDSLTITGVTQPSAGLVLHNDGNLTFDPNGEFDSLGVGQSQLVTFQYDISDGNGGTDTATVTVTVTGVDDATSTNPDFDSTDEESAITIDVLANDSDIDGNDSLTISAVSQPTDANDGVVVNNTNNITFTPGSNFDSLAFGESATTTFEYTAIAAGSGETTIETVTVTINGVNDNPVATDDGIRTDQDVPVTIDAVFNDTDSDTSDFLIVTGVDQPSKGSATINSENRIVFDPGDDFDSLDDGIEETVTFDYFISDGNGGTDVATVTVTVTGVEDATVTAPDEGVTDEATAITLSVLDNDTDPDTGEVLVINSVSAPSKGTTSTDGTTVTFNPNGEFEDLAVGETELVSFQYTLTTGEVETVTVTVNGLNDGPVAVNDAETTNEDTPVNIDLLGADDSLAADSDVDGDDLTLTEINGISASGTITLGSGALLTVNANGTVDYDPNGQFEDLDGGDQVTDSFTYTIADGNGSTDTATATVTINGVDDAMVTQPDEATTLEGTPVTIDVLSNDSDADAGDNPLEIASVSQPADTDDGVAVIAGTNVTFTPGTNFESLAVGESAVTTFEYTARAPGSLETQTETVTVTVIGQNDAPVADDDVGSVNEDATTTVNAAGGVLINDSDVDLGDGLTVTGVRTGPEMGTGTGALVGNQLVGTYGTLTLNSDGSYRYAADQDVTDALPVGATVDDVFTYTISDGNGGTDTAELRITITGVNDAPPSNPADGGVGVYDDSDTINEDETDPITGNVRTNDSDPDGDTLTVTEVNGVAANISNAVVGTFGELTLEADGSYSYELTNSNPVIQALAVGETEIDTFTYTADDGNGGSAIATLTITINGVNDAPPQDPTGTPGVDFGVFDDSNSIDEDEFPNTKSGNVLDNDLDPDGDTLTVSAVEGGSASVGASVTGTYGAVTINSNGEYTYALDNSNPAIQGLAVGDTVTDSFDYTASDGNGGTATATLTITINGTNDAPPSNPADGGVGVYDDVDTINEDETDPITGNVRTNDSDPDGDTLTVTEVNGVAANISNAVVGTFGELTLEADGSYSYELTNSNPVIQALAVGETQIDTFTYTADDGNGGSATATLTITINGVNDAPPQDPTGTPGVDFGVYDDQNSISEDAFPNNTTGNVLDNDLDPDGDVLTVSEVEGVSGNVGSQVSGAYGVVSITSDGNYNYQLDNSNVTVQALGVGETILETFEYTADDGNGGTATATLTITINGTNDAPDAIDDSGTGTEDSNITGNVLPNDTDIDGDTPLTVISNTTPSNGSVVVNADGSYVYTPNANFNGTDSFTYIVEDPNGATDTATVTLTVTPVNDLPVAANDAGTVDEDDTLTVNAVNGIVQTNDTDIDGDALTVSGIRTGGEGAAGTAGTVGVALTGDLGTLTLASDGSYSYTADQTAADNLAVGESSTDTFTYTISDGNGASDTAELVITVLGQNDGPRAFNDAGSVDEDATLNVNATGGVLSNDTDLDLSDGLTVTEIRTGPETGTGTGALVGNQLVGTYGTLTLNSDGSYSYTADQDVTDALPVGATVNDVFTYTVSDDHGATDLAELNITITGVNDAPPSNPADGGVGVYDDVDTINEDETDPITGNVRTNDSDPDGDTLTVTEVNGVAGNISNPVVGTFGDLTLNADGSYSYELTNSNPVIQALAVGETEIDTFTYTADDGNGGSATATLTITINGVNDAPPQDPTGTPGVDFGVFDDDNTVDEDQFPNSAIGNVLDNDLDPDGDTLTVSEVDGESSDVGSQVSGTYGVVTINSDGNYVYQLDNSNAAVQQLGAGETILETFDYTADDGNGGSATATLTITINGVNDVTVTAPDRGVTDEDTAITIDVLANDSDADQNDSLTIDSVTQPADANDGVVNNNGSDLTFTPGSNFDSLGVGESATTTFTYTTVAAGSGETSTETVTITVNGLNDAPTAMNDAETTDQNTTVNIDLLGADDSTAADSDPDNDTLQVTQINGITAGGVITLASGALLSVNGNGTVDYDPNGQFDSLDVGDSTTDSFTYVISDGNGGTDTATATVTINGVEDATDTDPDAGTTDEATPITLSVLDNDTDPDAGEVLTIASVSTPSKGSASTNGTTVTFDPNSDFEDLGVGESEVVTFEYTLTTGEVETVTITVNGINDAPVAVNDAEVTDQDSIVNIDLLGANDSTAADSDPDGDTLTVSEINGVTSGGTITLSSGALVTVNGNGTVDYNPNGQFDSLPAGSSLTDSFSYVISDGNGGTSTATATVTINGVDDAMETNPDFDTTFEGSPVTIDVLANDSDVDTGDTLTINSVNQPADTDDGTVVNNGTDLTFTPGSNFESLGVGESATTTFTYVVEAAGSGETRTETVTVTVNGLNDDPLAADDVGNTDEDSPVVVDVLVNDTDADTNDDLTVTAVSQPPAGQGTVSITNGGDDVTFDPGTDFQDLAQGETEIVVFDYDVSDGSGGNDNATVRVTVTGVNDNPDLVDDTATTDEDTAVVIDVLQNDSDLDNGDTLTLTDVTSPGAGNGTATITNGGTRVTFNPGSDFQDLAVGESELVTFQYEVTDSFGATSTANVTVTVEGVNDGPDADNDRDDTTENTSIVIDVLDNDEDPDASDTLTITNVSSTSSGRGTPSISGGGTTITFDVGTDFDYLTGSESEIVSFTYDISDGNGGTDTATVLVTVNGLNDGPDAVDDDLIETDEDIALVIPVLTNDTDPDTNDTLTVVSVDSPSLGSTAITNGGTTVTFTPGTDYNYLGEGETEIVSLDYTIADDAGVTDTATIFVTVNGTNDAPGAVNDSAGTTENSSVLIDVAFNDFEADSSDTLTVTSVTTPSPDQGTVTITNGGADVTFDPGTDFEDLGVGESRAVTFNYVVADDEGASDSAMVEVIVDGVNDGPSATDDDASTNENSSVVIDVLNNDTDPDLSDTLTVTSVSTPSPDQGTITITNGGADVTFDPGSDFDDLAVGESRAVSFDYVVTDDNGATATATVEVVVNGTNDGPSATDDDASTNENSSVVIDVLNNDTDPDLSDTLTVTSVSTPSPDQGTITITNGGADVTFDPGSDFDDLAVGESRAVSFDYVVTDDNGATATATVEVVVNGTNDGPSATDDDASTNENSPVTIDVLTNDTDPDLSDTLTVTSVTTPSPDEGTVTITNGGTDVTFDPGSDFDDLAVGESRAVSFDYVVTDDNGATASATVEVVVNGTNDGPSATDDDASTSENSSVVIDVLNNDTDPDLSDTLTVTSVTAPSPNQGTVNITNGGADVTFDPGSDFDDLAVGESRAVSFDYVVTDDNGATASATVEVVVNGTNDATITNPDSVVISPTTTNLVSGEETTANTMRAGSVDIVVTDSGRVDDGVDATFNNINAWSNPSISGSPSYQLAYDGGGSGTVTFTFSEAVTDPILHIDRLGGLSGGDNSSRWTLAEAGATLTDLGGTADWVVNSTSGYFEQLLTSDTDDETESSMDLNTGTAAGSVQVNGTFTSITFNLSMIGSPGIGDAVELAWEIEHHEYSATSINVISNDSDADTADNPLQIVSISTPSRGSASHDGTNVTFDPESDFAFLNNGESDQETITYTLNTGATGQVTFTVNGISAPEVPPIVIDLDGDGVEFDSIDDGINFDVDGDGIEERVAWADEDDAVLIYDENDNNDVDGLHEFAFARYSDDPNATDLDGLRAFDSNEDLILDANDEDFDSFKLWQDIDGDGEVGEGEMMTLAEAGIESLELVSDDQSYFTAGGDVKVHGEAAVNYADGSEGTLADAAFQYEELNGEDESLEIITDSGEVLDVNEHSAEIEPATSDILEGSGQPEPGADSHAPEGGASGPTSVDDDRAAADAAMS